MNIAELIDLQSQNILLHLGAALGIASFFVLFTLLLYKLVKMMFTKHKQGDVKRFYKKTKSAIILNSGIISFTIRPSVIALQKQPD